MIDRSQRVYFARCIGPTGDPIGAYKIGCSYGWNERAKQIGSGMPFTVEIEATVLGGYVMEKALHISLKEDCISGEYFHARGRVLEFVKRCATTGSPYLNIKDTAGTDTLPEGALQAFMTFHGVTLAEACAVLGFRESDYEKRASKKSYRSSKVVAAVAIVAARRGQYVNWPTDALRGLLGHESVVLKQNREQDRVREAKVAAAANLAVSA
ncbi:GIY-YIG nuclease family protein [Rhizobium sp. BK251]|uniref:GIY-YIG nuclease family protein n=1 Tax=Rhizobium sp. BK251 TaxID=2512125 RepID=UPI001050FA71|nr:GIY-YIG nuclease family protein [Rhizobium sp. BK251]TCL70615.1 hypothetical protein EV286_107492 [Rhizobium sp. BK251]